MLLRVILLFILFFSTTFVNANEGSTVDKKDPPIIGRFIINGGVSKMYIKEKKINGGSDSAKSPDDMQDIGGAVSGALFFNTSLNPYFSPYIDIATFLNKERYLVIPGIGVRHDFNVGQDHIVQPFLGTGIGYTRSEWSKSPAQEATSMGNSVEEIKEVGGSADWNIQAGSDFYLTNDLAINLTTRYDLYDITTNIKDSRYNKETKLEDNGTLSVLLGITYRFGNQSKKLCKDAPPGAKLDSFGCPFLDDDHDGVYNRNDLCPNTLPHVPVDATGCPPDTFQLALNYKFAKYQVSELTNKSLFDIPAFMKKHPEYHIKLIGYADSIGTDAFNLDLSRKREEAMKKYLIEHGVQESRVTGFARGNSEPVVKNDTEEHRDINRRISMEFSRINYNSKEKHSKLVTDVKQ
ncbi:MAG: OmpA family protein [Psychromonas sp.]|nr:OmpA family protein [Psychromonas sp.]